MPAKFLELKYTIKLIDELTTEIDEIEAEIKEIMDEEIPSPILTILEISYHIGVMIIAEKKHSKGKHYNVALSHATKKLGRLIYSMEKSGQPYSKAA